MKKVQSNEAKELKNSDTSKLLEYSIELKDKDIDFCINTIMGRYPEKGYPRLPLLILPAERFRSQIPGSCRGFPAAAVRFLLF